jgi:hypothetical protein
MPVMTRHITADSGSNWNAMSASSAPMVDPRHHQIEDQAAVLGQSAQLKEHRDDDQEADRGASCSRSRRRHRGRTTLDAGPEQEVRHRPEKRHERDPAQRRGGVDRDLVAGRARSPGRLRQP